MRVAIHLTVDIDPEAWEADYGVSGYAAIRQDVKEYIEHTLHSHLMSLSLLEPNGDGVRIRKQ